MFGNTHPMIDSHVHIRGCKHNSVKDMIRINHEIRCKLGLDSVCVASLQAGGLNSVEQNALCILFKMTYPDCYAYAGLDHYYCGADRTAEGYLLQVKTFMEMGFDGIKFIEYKPTCYKLLEAGFTDERFALCFSYLEENRIPVLWHVADPEQNWDAAKCSIEAVENGWCYADGTFAKKEELYAEVESVLKRFPNLNIVFAHLYYLSADIDRLERFLVHYPNVRIDVTPGPSMYYNFNRDRSRWQEFFIKYKKRILFGTDNGWDDISYAQNVVEGCSQIIMMDGFFTTDQPVLAWDGTMIQGLALPDETICCLYKSNFMDMQYGKAPKKVNSMIATEYIQSVLSGVINDQTVCVETKEQLIQVLGLLQDNEVERRDFEV